MLSSVRHGVASRRFAFALVLSSLPLVASLTADEQVGADAAPAETSDYAPAIAPASDHAERMRKRIRVPQGYQVELFAAEPLLANPVAFCTDEQGRFFVAETFRHHAGVTDNRNHMDWLDDDLASRTVADRVAMYRKHLGDKFATYAAEHDRVRLIEDRDGDGRADHATVFADGFRDAADGIGAGLLARRGNVWFACIPSLWTLRDDDQDGVADCRRALHTGYGVHVAFLGHDLHGLKLGPDGRLYFSIGDRGFNVETPDGALAYPDTGAVLRCNPDGSRLEVFATGLRNPQELAFDEYGNLFTGDNNSDGGDKARWVHVVEGGDSGWRMGYQYINTPTRRGPWNHEKLWTPEGAHDAAYLVPPIVNLADGPSGLVYQPGTGFLPEDRQRFYLCDFRGTALHSGVRSFALKPKGASFEVVDPKEFVWSVLATDVDFGPDSAMYITDWVEGWDKPKRGRIWRVTAKEPAADAQAAEVKRLIAAGMAKRGDEELVGLLKHPDMRIRQEAQFALAERGEASVRRLLETAQPSEHQLARIHAIWALGQIGRDAPQTLVPVTDLLSDGDPEIRAQAAKVLGEAKLAAAADRLNALLADPEPRVRLFAALAVGKLGLPASIPAIVDFLRANDNGDPILRHAGVMALTWINDPPATLRFADDSSAAVRLGVLLTLRRWESPEIARYLNDGDPAIVLEVARAINDAPIDVARPHLAALASRSGMRDEIALRALNASFRGGAPDDAQRVAGFAADAGNSELARVEAMEMLSAWAEPSGRDRVMGLWRPLPKRDSSIASSAANRVVADLLRQNAEPIVVAAARIAGELKLAAAADELNRLALDAKQTPSVRVESLKALAAINDPALELAVKAAVNDGDASVRSEGRRWLARLRPDDAIPVIEAVLREGSITEQQAALATLGEIAAPQADALLIASLDKLRAGELKPETHLDLLLAAESKANPAVQSKLAECRPASADPLAVYAACLHGGDAGRGRQIFFEKTEAACLRCHRVGTKGGEVGPPLSGVASREKRDYLLESIVAPNRRIAKGFETVVLALEDGQSVVGVLKSEDDDVLQLVSFEGNAIAVKKSDISERSSGDSAMPEQAVKTLSKREIRDLVEFLSTLK